MCVWHVHTLRTYQLSLEQSTTSQLHAHANNTIEVTSIPYGSCPHLCYTPLSSRSCPYLIIITHNVYTVKLTDTPRYGQPPYNGHRPWHEPLPPYYSLVPRPTLPDFFLGTRLTSTCVNVCPSIIIIDTSCLLNSTTMLIVYKLHVQCTESFAR